MSLRFVRVLAVSVGVIAVTASLPPATGVATTGVLDKTFGPEVKFVGIPPGMKPNRPPSDGFQFFGLLRASAKTRALTVELRDLAGKTLYSLELPPQR